jgi:gas vesicle protein
MRFVIGAVALLVLGSIIGSLAGMLFWPDLSYATSSVTGMRLERHGADQRNGDNRMG